MSTNHPVVSALNVDNNLQFSSTGLAVGSANYGGPCLNVQGNVRADNTYYSGSSAGKTLNINVLNSLTVSSGAVTAQRWYQLQFQGGILIGLAGP